ncbi:MAG: rhodanese-like domain-containing protein [Dokdonella sp.]
MTISARTILAFFALAVGALAAFAGTAQAPLADDEIAAVDLAARLRAHQQGLLVLDTRSRVAFDAEHLPGARLLADAVATKLVDTTTVVYSDTDVDSAVAVALRRQTDARTLRLRGGLRAWNDEILFPVVRADASARQRQRFEARAALSRYFGGTPRRLEPGAAAGPTRGRRGC